MPYRIRLDEAINQILDAIVGAIEAEVTEGGLLEGVKTVIRGDRTRPKPDTPSVFVFSDIAQTRETPRTLAETWSMPVIMVVTVRETEPEKGYRSATELAAKVRSVVLKDRSLGLRHFVQDVRSMQFDPGGGEYNEGSLFGAAATVEVIFTILEP